MFEAKPPRPEAARPLPAEPWEDDALRQLTWADLVARLSATRGAYPAAGDVEDGCEASFDASCARRIAAHHHGKHPVNSDSSTNGKGADGTASPPVGGAGLGALRK